MVKDSMAHVVRVEIVRGILSSRVALFRLLRWVEKITREHPDATTVATAIALLCVGLFGLWFKILTTTGI